MNIQKKFRFLKKIVFDQDIKIKNILKSISLTVKYTDGNAFAIIVNKNKECIGVVTDGDIRRALSKSCSIENPIKNVLKNKFIFVYEDETYHNVIRAFDRNIDFIPVLSKKKIPIDLFIKSKFYLSKFNFSEKIVRARAPLRVSFSGGGTDFSQLIDKKNSTVISCTLDKYCTSTIIVRKDLKINIISKDLNKKYSCNNLASLKFDGVLDLIKSVIVAMQPNFGFDLETFSETEPGTGLGSSSALVVSIISAFNYFRNTNSFDNYQIADLAYKIERLDQKIEGGWQDQYASSFGGFNLINFKKREIFVEQLKIPKNVKLELEYNLMLFKLKNSRKSSLIQKKLKKKMKSLASEKKILRDIKEITTTIKSCLFKGDVKTFGDMLHSSWLLKKKTNQMVTNSYIDKCYNTALKFGALGGKLLGAGETGYLLVYSAPIFHKTIKEKLKRLGATYERFRFSDNGIEVWTTNK
jgi:D-glycero-alpha-D-manno-heptose-7-phosphate kinase